MLWHNRLTLLPFILSKYTDQLIFTAFISNSQDGELLAALVNAYKRGKVIRVPHSTRHQALKELIKRLMESNEVVIITPDGPRGPKNQIKPGIILAAKQTQASIIPLSWHASHFWQLKTWDGLIFPKPFSKIIVSFGKPITVNHDIDIENGKALLKDALDNL